MQIALKNNPYPILLWTFAGCLATVLLFPIEQLIFFLPLAYFLFAAGFVWKHREIQKRKALVLWAVVYIIIGILDGAFLTFFWRAVVLLILPVLFGISQRSWLRGKKEIAAVAALFTAPMLLLWGGSTQLDDAAQLVIFLFLGAIVGFIGFYLVAASKVKLLPLALTTGAIILAIAAAIPNVIAYTGVRPTNLKSPVMEGPFTDVTGKKFSVGAMQGKIVVLDFWFTGCGYCFEKFPEFEAFADAHKNESMVFATVNVPLPEQVPQKLKNLDLLRKYHFQKWVAAGNSDDFQELGFLYPRVLVFDKKGQLRYNGNLFRGRQYFVNNMEDLLAKFQKE